MGMDYSFLLIPSLKTLNNSTKERLRNFLNNPMQHVPQLINKLWQFKNRDATTQLEIEDLLDYLRDDAEDEIREELMDVISKIRSGISSEKPFEFEFEDDSDPMYVFVVILLLWSPLRDFISPDWSRGIYDKALKEV